MFGLMSEAKMKIAIIDDTNEVLNKYAADLGVTILTNSLIEPVSWNDTDVCFIIADTTKDNVLDDFKKVIEVVKQQNIMTIPVLITDDEDFAADNVTDLAMVLNKHWFNNADELYSYIGENMAFMQSIISNTEFMSIDLDDIKAAWGNSGRIIFSCSEYKAGEDEHQAIDTVKQKLKNMNFPIGSEKSIIFTLSGDVAEDSLFSFNSLIMDEFEAGDCLIIFGVTNDNVTDKIKLSMWLEY